MDESRDVNIIGIGQDFFERKEFIPRLKKVLSRINSSFPKANRTNIKGFLNTVSERSHQIYDDEKKIAKVHLLLLKTFTEYAYYYECKITFGNVLRQLEEGEYREILSSKYTYEHKYLRAKCYNGLFNIALGEKENKYSIDDLKLLMTSKSLLISIYVNYIDNKIKPNKLLNLGIEDVLIFLASVLIQLCRWNEAYHYIGQIDKIKSRHLGNSIYLKSMLLDTLRKNACLDYNGLLLLELIDNYSTIKRQKYRLDERQLNFLEKISNASKRKLEKYNVDFEVLRNHKEEQLYENKHQYESFVYTKDLYINEHTFFCTCKESYKDNLTIATSHKHTQKKWLEPIESLLNKLIADYALARNEYYFSTDDVPLSGHNLTFINRKKVFRDNYKRSLLLSSFKSCYSILDTLGQVIIGSLKELGMAQKNADYKSSKVYFLNLWEVYDIDDQLYIENQFLHSLESIAIDLSNNKAAALHSFKKIRNAIEHKILVISDDPSKYHQFDRYIISESSMRNKAEIMLQLTKSAILAFTYFYRRLSLKYGGDCGEN